MINLGQLFKTKDKDDNTPQTGQNADTAYAGLANGAISTPRFDDISPTQDITTSKQTYEEHGFTVAASNKGDVNALRTNLEAVTLSIKTKHRNDKALQDKHQKEVQGQIDIIKQGITNKELAKERNLQAIEQLQEDIKSKKDEIVAIKKDPASIGDINPLSKASLYIGGIILGFLTIYLFTFYSSASYSAFFKAFTPDDEAIHQSIFDARAIPLAWEYGFTALAFIVLIPFVFLGLGYLIHKFQEGKKISGYIKAIALVFITLLFDILLAYDIVKKIYEVKAANSFEDVPPYSLSLAIEDVNFWIIIFAGFVVYLVWGFVFDFTMEAYADSDRVNTRIRSIQQGIDNLHEQINNITNNTNTLNAEIADLNIELQKAQSKLGHFHFNIVDLKQELTNFFNGWIRYLKQANVVDTAPHYNVFNDYTNQINQ